MQYSIFRFGRMGGRRGWLKIVEAFIAILLIISVVIIILSRTSPADRAGEIQNLESSLLAQISINDALRQEIFAGSASGAAAFAEKMKPAYLDFEIKICALEEVCAMDTYMERDIYAKEIVFFSTLEEYSPKKLKLFMWVK